MFSVNVWCDLWRALRKCNAVHQWYTRLGWTSAIGCWHINCVRLFREKVFLVFRYQHALSLLDLFDAQQVVLFTSQSCLYIKFSLCSHCFLSMWKIQSSFLNVYSKIAPFMSHSLQWLYVVFLALVVIISSLGATATASPAFPTKKSKFWICFVNISKKYFHFLKLARVNSNMLI